MCLSWLTHPLTGLCLNFWGEGGEINDHKMGFGSRVVCLIVIYQWHLSFLVFISFHMLNISLRKLSLRRLIFIEKFNSKVKQECNTFYWTSSTESSKAHTRDIRMSLDYGQARVSVYELSLLMGVGVCAQWRWTHTCEITDREPQP